jgi:cytoskeletal protein CcmA (bactofilin family)
VFRKSKRPTLNPEPAAPSSSPRPAGPEASVIGNGVSIKGDIHGDGEVVIQGRLEGELKIQGTVSIGPDGHSKGRVVADEVVLDGTIEGEVEAGQRLVISASGVLNGGMHCPRLVVEEGGRLQGRCHMSAQPEGAPAQERERPLLPSFQEAVESGR